MIMSLSPEARRRDARDLLRAAGSPSPRAVVLVEGESDQRALQALADRRGRDLAAEGVVVLPMGGSKNIGRYLDLFGPQGLDLRLAGLYDAAEERDFQRGLERAGFGAGLTRGQLEDLGFHVCVADLEEELIRAVGVTAVEEVLRAQGERASLRTFRRQPVWQGRPPHEQLLRFLGTHSGRKIETAPLLIDALVPERRVEPLDGVLASLSRQR